MSSEADLVSLCVLRLEVDNKVEETTGRIINRKKFKYILNMNHQFRKK